MQLGTFTPRPPMENGDQLNAKEAIDRPLVILVREHRTGIKTKYNSNPNEKNYKPEGGEGVTVDVADIHTNETWLDVLWLNGAIVDNLAAYIGQTIPVKLTWQPSAKGGNPYITVIPLEGQELALAQQWALTNPHRFDTERATRTQQPTTTPAPATPPATIPTPVATPPAPAAPQPTALTQAASAQDPQIQALLAQLAAQQAQQTTT